MLKGKVFVSLLISLVFLTACSTNPTIGGGDQSLIATISALQTQVGNPQSVPPTPPTIATQPAAITNPQPSEESSSSAPVACAFAAVPGNPDGMPKTTIELAPTGQWFHRVFNPRLFHTPNWDGADSWFVTLALGNNSGGNWISHGNPGQIIYRATSTNISWCLGVLTNVEWKNQFMGEGTMPAAINVRISPNTTVTVVTASGKTVNQETSDMGDITIILPDSGKVTISVSYTTAAPTHESLVWWGPYDRSENINTIDAR